MATLVENYICQHFENIYKEICNGTAGQAAWRKLKGKTVYPYWRIHASKASVLYSIMQFFHLCLNASRIDRRYGKIERWTNQLLVISCTPLDSDITNANDYSMLVLASDPFTKFIFSCFDWLVDDANASYDERIKYYKKCAKEGGCFDSSQLLYDLKNPRNDEVHESKELFYSEHSQCMQRLVYTLYDYICIFYMISHVCKEHRESIALLDSICQKVQMPSSFLETHIIVECIDEVSGNAVPKRKEDIRLYCIGENGEKTLVNAVAGCPNKFKVSYYGEYVISVVTDGKESDSSEKLVIEHDFVDGTIVKINIPPNGRLEPVKISIRELVFKLKDLPSDVKWILNSIEGFTARDMYAELAWQLTMASVTKSEMSKKAFQDAVKQLKESLKQELKEEQPGNLNDFIQTEMLKFQKRLSEPFNPYRGKEDFFELLESINMLYTDFGFLHSSHNEDKPLGEQLKENAEDLLSGKRLSFGTTASDRLNEIQKELTILGAILSLSEKYPEVVEAEIGKDWLQNRIEELYVAQINYYMYSVIPLHNSISDLYNYVKKTAESKNEDDHISLIYVELIKSYLNDTPDNILRIVELCSDTLMFWLDKCGTNDGHTDKLKEVCKDQIRLLKKTCRKLQLPMIPVNEEEGEELKEQLSALRTHVSELKDRKSSFHLVLETATQKVMERRKNENSMLDRLLLHWDNQPECKRDIRSEIHFESLLQILSNSDSETLMQIICLPGHISPLIFQLLDCSELGIGCKGLCDEWLVAYQEWINQNKSILQECCDIMLSIRKKYSNRKRTTANDRYILSDVESNDVQAKLIVEIQTRQIESNYGGDVPDYIQWIMKVSESILPSHVKALFLQKVLKPSTCPTENLVYVIKDVMRYWEYSSKSARALLLDYITKDYGKLLITQEALDEFKLMSREAQQEYLEILMNDFPSVASLPKGVRYMKAYNLNFANGGNGREIIEARKFFKMMANMSMPVIKPYDGEEFAAITYVVSLDAQFSKQNPDDEELAALSSKQTSEYCSACSEYLDKYLVISPIEEGEWGDFSLLHKINLHRNLKGKSPDEQVIVRYKDLFNGLDYILELPERFKSGWCKSEGELFSQIVEMMKGMPVERQQELSKELWQLIAWSSHKMPYDDIKAERLMALKPFYDQGRFDQDVDSYYSMCTHGSIIIGNPSVLEGLDVIRTLFMKYGQKVNVLFDGQPTGFVDILITIYKLIQVSHVYGDE